MYIYIYMYDIYIYIYIFMYDIYIYVYIYIYIYVYMHRYVCIYVFYMLHMLLLLCQTYENWWIPSLTPRLLPGVLVYAADRLMRQLCTIFTPDRIPPNDFLQLAYCHLAMLVWAGGFNFLWVLLAKEHGLGMSNDDLKPPRSLFLWFSKVTKHGKQKHCQP